MNNNFIVRSRSFSSVPKKKFNITQFMNQKETTIKTQRNQLDLKTNELLQKNQQIYKLRRNLEHAANMAIQERIHSSRANQDKAFMSQNKQFLERKITQLKKDNLYQKEKRESLQKEKQILKHDITQLTIFLNEQKEKIINIQAQLVEQKQQNEQNRLTIKKLENVGQLQLRIKQLEKQLRDEKIKTHQLNELVNKLQDDKANLRQQIKKQKPYQQELKERIAYFQRVAVDLSRKMEDFNRRENQYIKQISQLKASLQKVTQQRNALRKQLDETIQKLNEKSEYCITLQNQISQKKQNIERLSSQLSTQKQVTAKLKYQLENTVEFYKEQTIQNAQIKKKNALLQKHQSQMHKTIQQYTKVAEAVDYLLIERNHEIKKITTKNQELQKANEELLKKFEKFDVLFMQQTQKSQTAIRQSVYGTMRINMKLQLQLKEANEEYQVQLLKFGQQRDDLEKRLNYFTQNKKQLTQFYEIIYEQKFNEILLLEKSNDQLLKVKRDMQDRVKEVQRQLQQSKKQIYALRLKAADLFKIKKQLEQAKKTIQRYNGMIEQQKDSIQDLKSQIAILRNRISVLQDKNFTLDLQNQNLNIKIQELGSIMGQLDIQVLEKKKKANEKNAHFLHDGLEKIANAIRSLQYFFTCSFCSLYPLNPVTLANCGHNYCQKCKEAYNDSCYQCDTGIPIEKIFFNKFLKQCTGKYKFLVMVIDEVKGNFLKNQ